MVNLEKDKTETNLYFVEDRVNYQEEPEKLEELTDILLELLDRGHSAQDVTFDHETVDGISWP